MPRALRSSQRTMYAPPPHKTLVICSRGRLAREAAVGPLAIPRARRQLRGPFLRGRTRPTVSGRCWPMRSTAGSTAASSTSGRRSQSDDACTHHWVRLLPKSGFARISHAHQVATEKPSSCEYSIRGPANRPSDDGGCSRPPARYLGSSALGLDPRFAPPFEASAGPCKRAFEAPVAGSAGR
jgi:hypothetical protein